MSARISRAALVPAAALLIALLQLTLVHTRGLSRWRLGGFGMYSDYHPEHLQLWLVSADARRLISPATPLKPGCDPASAERCLRWANASCLEQLHACLRDAPPDSAVELWRPNLSADAAHLDRALIARWPLP